MINSKSKIEWTESTWNPITGCTKVSPGCKFCYAERMSKRLQAMGKPTYINGFQVAVHEETFEYPLLIKKPKVIFVNSMSDLFIRRGLSLLFLYFLLPFKSSFLPGVS